MRGVTTLIASVLLVAPLPANDAVELGPAPISNGGFVGRIAAVACSPTDNLTYYAGAADGGVWKTVDGGSTWVSLTDRMPTQAIGALALDPTDENIVYVGTGEANYANHSRYGLGLYKSADGGVSWAQLAEDVFAGRCFSRLIVDHANPQRLYAAITRAGGFPELAAARNHPQAEGPLGAWRSDDGGATWTQLSGGLPTDLSVTDLAQHPTDPQTLYACVGRIFGDDANGIYRTTDGGVSWARLEHESLPSNWAAQGRISIAIAPSQPERIYAMITQRATPEGASAEMRGAYRSDDGGSTWQLLPLANIQATYGWYLSVIVVGQSDPDLVFMGGLSLERSRDGGQTWDTVTPPHVDIHALVWDAAGRLLCGNDGGLHRSRTEGAGWRALNDGLGTIQFYPGISTHPNNAELFLGGTQDNGSNRRSAGGVAWQQVLGGDGGWTQINQVDPSHVYAEFQGTGNLYRSTNGGGGAFVQIAFGINRGDRNCFLPPYLIDPQNPDRMLYATHRIYESVDRGSSWQRITGDVTDGSGAVRSLAIAPSDSNYVYAATTDGLVQRSTDGGNTWTRIREGHPGWVRTAREIAVDPADARTVYLTAAAFGATQIQRSRDAGDTWEALDENFPDLPANTVAVDSRSGPAVIYVGTDRGLFRSVDDGQTWHRYGPDLPYATITDLVFEPARARLVVGTQGRGAWDQAASYAGDLDFDNDVDLADLAVLLAALPCDGLECPGDVDGDGVTDLGDLQRLLVDFGR